MEQDLEQLMSTALAQAHLALGRTHPNPAVGALIVHRGEIVARGHTQPVGQAHAERVALHQFHAAGLRADESTMLVVTLEPCSTHGRTGACTEAIIESGIRRVVVGATDPNPAHCGRGLDILLNAGIVVTSGILEDACSDLNLVFNNWMATGRTFLAGKVATTLDGRIATRGGQSRWITGSSARADVHRWRAAFPAIAIGAGTLRTDDPSLTVRREGHGERCGVRFLFDRNLVTPTFQSAKLFSDAWREQTIIVTYQSRARAAAMLTDSMGLRFWLLNDEAHDDGVAEFLQRCKQEEITGVYVEGGAQLLTTFLKHRALNYLFHYRAPKLLADPSALAPFSGYEPVDMNAAIRLTQVRHQVFGDDQLMRGYIAYPP